MSRPSTKEGGLALGGHGLGKHRLPGPGGPEEEDALPWLQQAGEELGPWVALKQGYAQKNLLRHLPSEMDWKARAVKVKKIVIVDLLKTPLATHSC